MKEKDILLSNLNEKLGKLESSFADMNVKKSMKSTKPKKSLNVRNVNLNQIPQEF